MGPLAFPLADRLPPGETQGTAMPHRESVACGSTMDWIRLRWVDGRAREGGTTPGPHFLDELGGFPTTPEMTRTGGATVVRA